jgi:hypothetical protein
MTRFVFGSLFFVAAGLIFGGAAGATAPGGGVAQAGGAARQHDPGAGPAPPRVHLGSSGPGRLATTWLRAVAVIISTGSREYVAARSGVIATFVPDPPIAGVSGIERIEEGTFQNGKWIASRRLNEDENHQGVICDCPRASLESRDSGSIADRSRLGAAGDCHLQASK